MPLARHAAARQAGALAARLRGARPLAPAASAAGRAGGDAPPDSTPIRGGAGGGGATATAAPPLVSDADLVRSLTGAATDPVPRAYAPPAEPRVCRCCAGTALTTCAACSGSGSLPPGGFRATNPVIMPKIVGTTWTAAERTLGRTHFRCADKRRAAKLVGAAAPQPPQEEDDPAAPPSPPPPPPAANAWFVLMVSACDPAIRLWVEARSLKDRARWTPGWVTVADVAARRAADAERAAAGGKRKGARGVGPRAGPGCKACGGRGRVACRLCSRPGEVIEV